MITKALSSKLVLLVIGLAAGSGILIPAGYASFHPVTSSEIQNETILSADIKNGEVKAADIATDAVGASELQGVTKLLFGECVLTSAEASSNIPSGSTFSKICNVGGVDDDDFAIATLNDGSSCFEVAKVNTGSGIVNVLIRNDCTFTTNVGSPAAIGVIVYDK